MSYLEKVLSFEPPPQSEVKKSRTLLQRYFSPVYSGMDNINPRRPTLFVGNHTRFGVLDVPLLSRELYLQKGIFVRSLADRAHFDIPLWRDYLYKNGAVLGSREVCNALMEAGESIMVFPGGAREVVKGKGMCYKLLWRERLGFVRMAIQNGYSITPFSSVGADEALDVIADYDDFMDALPGKLIKTAGLEKHLRDGEMLMPIPRGIGLTPFPRPERFYFSIGKPIETRRYRGKHEDKEVLHKIQARVADSINDMIKDSMLQRAHNRHDQPLIRRLLQRS